jgi:two-component system sensor histidine kinase KdpD
MKAALGRRPIELDLEQAPLLIRGDPVLLEQLLANLLENVARHTPEDTRVRISARRKYDVIELTVTDDGPGLPAEIEPERLFEKFQRGGTPDQPADRYGAAGVGLGLALCRAVAHAHGGEIRAERIPAGGAMFVLTLPASDEVPEVPCEDRLA